ncbi:uncharacterized protein BJ171DRAFT_133179 [Polychytrium aggregatum]|uniref:uncharacterized protein n=1 Tax=Polychytrium aggregatum TaxID=110093 RepID=UPI0022FE5A7D|nr:uncharacterized protein BJ171DRAFT_133179 [Polychytrium aggregatum]KAI9203797.1 hypothetical protein BJ171DRAFT_133179 [Polychytrium aggregatum]
MMQDETPAVRSWLTRHNFTPYISILLAQGFDTLDVLLDMSRDELLGCGLAVGHANRFLKAARRERLVLAAQAGLTNSAFALSDQPPSMVVGNLLDSQIASSSLLSAGSMFDINMHDFGPDMPSISPSVLHDLHDPHAPAAASIATPESIVPDSPGSSSTANLVSPATAIQPPHQPTRPQSPASEHSDASHSSDGNHSHDSSESDSSGDESDHGSDSATDAADQPMTHSAPCRSPAKRANPEKAHRTATGDHGSGCSTIVPVLEHPNDMSMDDPSDEEGEFIGANGKSLYLLNNLRPIEDSEVVLTDGENEQNALSRYNTVTNFGFTKTELEHLGFSTNQTLRQWNPEALFRLSVMLLNVDAQTAADPNPRALALLSYCSEGLSHLQSRYILAWMYLIGWAVKQNIPKAVQYLKRLIQRAQQVSSHELTPPSAFLIGFLYFNGVGVEKDSDQASYYYRQSLCSNFKLAEELFAYSSEGDDPRKFSCDSEMAKEFLQWCKRGALLDRAFAIHLLGDCSYFGHGTAFNYRQAAKYYTEAVHSHSFAPSQFCLGMCYEEGQGVEQDFGYAWNLYHASAFQGDALAEFHLGMYYYNGDEANGCDTRVDYTYVDGRKKKASLVLRTKDIDKALVWLKQSAKQGFWKAQAQLADIYFFGEPGVTAIVTQAARWYLRAANHGYAQAQKDIAECYSAGTGVRKNHSEAFRWNLIAACEGHPVAQNNLGVSYSDGVGVIQDYQKAKEWFEKSAAQGNEMAKRNLTIYRQDIEDDAFFQHHLKLAERGDTRSMYEVGECYFSGLHQVKEDHSVALHYFRRCIEADDPDPRVYNALGKCYLDGRGVDVDKDRAVQLFQQGQALNDPDATVHLGICYRDGIVVPKNEVIAVKLFERATELNSAEAWECLGKLLQTSSDEKEASRARSYLKMAKSMNPEKYKRMNTSAPRKARVGVTSTRARGKAAVGSRKKK